MCVCMFPTSCIRRRWRAIDRCATQRFTGQADPGAPQAITPASLTSVIEALQLDPTTTAHILWVGCGDAREALCLVESFPALHVFGIDVNAFAVDSAVGLRSQMLKDDYVTSRRLRLIWLDFFELHARDVMFKHPLTHIYTTAQWGSDLTLRLLRFVLEVPSIQCVVMFADSWMKAGLNFKTAHGVNQRLAQHVQSPLDAVRLSGSGNRRRLQALTINDEVRALLREFLAPLDV